MRAPFPALITTLAVGLSAAAVAAPADYGVLPNATLVKFESEAPLENITGISTEAKGTLRVDRDAPEATTAELAVPVASLRTGNTTRDEHLQSKDWLDAGAHPHITFAIASISLEEEGALAPDATRSGEATGTLTIKGTAREVTVPIKVTFLPSNEKLRRAFIKGDVVRVRTQFEVELSDFGVKPPDHLVGVKVAETVTIQASITAATGAK